MATLPAAAQDYPNKMIKVYVGFPAGTSNDIATRHFTDRLQRLSGQVVVVENKVGLNGQMAMEAVARSKNDGYSLIFGPGAAAAVQYKSLPYDGVKDFTRIASVLAYPFVLLVNPRTTPVNSVAELAAHLKKKDKVSYGSPNSVSLVGGSMFSDREGLRAISVNYKSTADAVRDLNFGDLDFIFVDSAFALAHMREGRLKGLGITFTKRSVNVPELPTMQELGYPDFDFYGWLAVYAPAGIPREVSDKLEKWILQIANSDETLAFYKQIGADPFVLNAVDYGKWEDKEFVAWKERARIASIPAN